MRFAVAALSGLILAGCGTIADYHDDGTIETFAPLIAVTGDALDGYRVASSDRVRLPYLELYGVDSDIFFRAYSYADGRAQVQVYMWTEASDWLFPYALNFGSPLRSVEARKVDSDVDCMSARTCEHREDTVVNLSDDDVRYLLSDAAPETIDVRLKTRGGDVDRTIRKAELVATLDAVGLTERFR